jgi:hypothetical protein
MTRLSGGDHDGHNPDSVSVAELLARAFAEGSPLHLAWRDDGTYINPDKYPTVEIPVIRDDDQQPGISDGR